MKTLRTLYIGIAAAVLCSCIQEVRPEGQKVSGMWAIVNEQSQTKECIFFEDGYMTVFSADDSKTVAEGQIWHSVKTEFKSIKTQKYSLTAENQLFLDGKYSCEMKIDGDSMAYGKQKALAVSEFTSEWYSTITTNVTDNQIKADFLSHELVFDFSVTNPLPNSSVRAVVSPGNMATVTLSKEGKMTVVLPEVNKAGTATITLMYPGAKDLVISLVREAATSISLTKTDWEYDYTGQSVTIPFTVSNLLSGETVKAALSAEGSDWIKDITVGSSSLSFRLDENNDPSSSSRSSSISLSTKGALDVKVQIIQRYWSPSFNYFPSSLSTDYTAKASQTFLYTVINPRVGGTVSVSCSSSWITNLKDNNGTVTFDVAENNSGSSRSASITTRYSFGGYSITKSFTVSQTYSATGISFTPSSQSTDYTAKSLSFTYAISNPRQGATASASTTDSWITDVKLSGTTASYKVAENNSGALRIGKIKLTYAAVTAEFSITQIGLPIINGHEYVDLGLSVKWATCNVGASKPEDFGGYYQWAGIKDVTDKSIYLDFNNCPYHTGSDYETGWTRYVPSGKSSYWSGTGSPDNKTVLDPSDDVASAEWKGSWRMPTVAEWEELINTSNCSWTWTTINGIKGYKVQSKKPGYTDNWIFLPAAGYRDYGCGLNGVGSYGHYWSSSLYTGSPSSAYRVSFNSSFVYGDDRYRYYGHSVRAVSE